jgi:ABC-type transporter Mla MlaB component
MFRVSKTEEESRTLIAVDGELAGDSIGAVQTCCDEAMKAGKAVDLFLRDVSTVDQAGRDLLCRLAAKGVRLRASGVYTSYMVRALSADRAESSGAGKVARPAPSDAR